ncbi:MAG TPA: TetR/AcrR family transcriptional regulator [Acidobacteriaceae bacterium]|jgi:TetR/AcrR family transcriptional repressor of nem operon
MKVSKETMAEHREQIITAAARRFRECGFDGVSVADIMKEVGLTHGGFYRHFSSKEELVALAALRAMTEGVAKWQKVIDAAQGDRLETVVNSYLSLRHHDLPDRGCLLATLGSELSRQPSAVKETVTLGQRKFLDFLSGIAPGKTKALRRKQAVVALAAMVGGMTLARATSDPQLRQEILDTVAESVPNSVRAAS